jgi:hypothetical protein
VSVLCISRMTEVSALHHSLPFHDRELIGIGYGTSKLQWGRDKQADVFHFHTMNYQAASFHPETTSAKLSVHKPACTAHFSSLPTRAPTSIQRRPPRAPEEKLPAYPAEL